MTRSASKIGLSSRNNVACVRRRGNARFHSDRYSNTSQQQGRPPQVVTVGRGTTIPAIVAESVVPVVSLPHQRDRFNENRTISRFPILSPASPLRHSASNRPAEHRILTFVIAFRFVRPRSGDNLQGNLATQDLSIMRIVSVFWHPDPFIESATFPKWLLSVDEVVTKRSRGCE